MLPLAMLQLCIDIIMRCLETTYQQCACAFYAAATSKRDEPRLVDTLHKIRPHVALDTGFKLDGYVQDSFYSCKHTFKTM